MNIIKEKLFPVNTLEIIYAVLFAVMCVLDRHIVNEAAYKTTILTTYISAFELIDIVLLPLITILCYAILQLIKLGISRLKREWLFKDESISISRKGELAFFSIAILLISLVWLPYLMSYWPGGVYNDTFDSISIALGKQEWDNQNTILYALFWKLIFWMGGIVNQGDYGGLKLMTIVQPAIMIGVAVSFFNWLYRRGVRLYIVIIGLLVFALAPVFPFYAISLWKDTLFSVSMFLYSWLLYVIVVEICGLMSGSNNEGRIGAKRIIQLIIMSLLVIFGRNNGIYIVLVSSLALIITMVRRLAKKDSIRLITSLLLVIAVSMVIKGPVYNSMGIKQSDKVEQYGIPLQQVGYMISASANMTEEEKEIIEGVMPLAAWINLYNPICVDTMKFDPLFNRSYFDTHTAEFLMAYGGMVIKNPVLAIKGYLLATLGFWDIWQSSSSAYICTEHCWNSGYFMSDYFNVYTGMVLSDIVGPRWYISAGLLAWIMLLVCVLLLVRKSKGEELVVIMPILSLWITLMIATPLAFSFRYVFSLLLCIPIYLIALFSDKKMRQD